MSLIGTIVKGILGNDAANKQRDAIVDGNKQATAIARDQYNQDRADYAPYREFGYAAVDGPNGLRALLGLGAAPAGGTVAPVSSSTGGFDVQSYMAANPDVVQHWQNTPAARSRYKTAEDFARYHYDAHGRAEGRPGTSFGATSAAPAASAPAAGGNGILEALRSTPGYGFQMEEGTRAIESSLAARGLSNSGAAKKALQKYGQGLADQTYGQAVDRLFQAANIGTGAQAQVTQSGSTYAANAGNMALSTAGANADRAVNRAGIWADAFDGLEEAASSAGGYGKLFKFG